MIIPNKIVYNNGYLEKEILVSIKEIIKLETNKDILLYIENYLKQKQKITVGEYILFGLFVKVGIDKYVDFSGNYVGFFNEVSFLDRFKPSFNMLLKGNIDNILFELKELYGGNTLKHILYFYIFFKSKKYVKTVDSKNTNNISKNKINSSNTIIHIDKQDFIFIEISRILGRLKEIEIHSFYRDNMLNAKLKTYFTSLSLGFKKINYNDNKSSDSVLIPSSINYDKHNLIIIEKPFWEKNKDIFNTGSSNYILVLERYLKK